MAGTSTPYEAGAAGGEHVPRATTVYREHNSTGRYGRDTPSVTLGPAGSVQGVPVNPGVAWLVFPGIGECRAERSGI